jgi:hypothetical protein
VPRYFFHVEDGQLFSDLHGTELVDLDAARREAIRFTSALLLEKPDAFWDHGEWTMRVTNDRDLTLFTLTFLASDAPALGGG